jgi:hypothetical protein
MAKKKYCGPDVYCIVTGAPDSDVHHPKSRGSGGPDEPWNMMPLAHRLHQECHNIGLKRFAEKYPAVKQWLLDHQWTLDRKWRHPTKQGENS